MQIGVKWYWRVLYFYAYDHIGNLVKGTWRVSFMLSISHLYYNFTLSYLWKYFYTHWHNNRHVTILYHTTWFHNGVVYCFFFCSFLFVAWLEQQINMLWWTQHCLYFLYIQHLLFFYFTVTFTLMLHILKLRRRQCL